MAHPVYYVEENDTLPILFDTFDGGTGASITMTGLAVTDIEIYKDGSITQRSSDAGYTLIDSDGIDIDGVTGIHGFTLDLSDNTDAGFYAVGSWYHVVVSSVTVDGQTVSFIAAAFRIVSATRGMAGTALPDAAADAAGGLPISDAGGLDLDAMNTNISNIDTDTSSLNDTKIPDTLSLANINGEVDTALTDIGLDHLLGASVTGTDVTDNSIVAKLVSSSATADWDDFDNTTDSHQAIRDRGDAAWTTGAGTGLTPLASGTAQGGTASTIQLAAGETFADDELNGNVVNITGGTGAGQSRLVSDYTGSTDTATVTPNWTTTPSTDSTYEVVQGSVNVAQIENADPTDQIRDAVVDDATRIDASSLNTASNTIGSDGTGLTEAGGTGDHLTAVPWNAAWDAEVESEVDDALVAQGLDHLLGAAVTGTDVTDDSVVAKLVSSSATADWDTFDNTTESHQALRDHIGDGTNLTEAGGDGDHLTEAGGTGDHLTAVPEVTADVTKISGSAAAADNLEASAKTIVVDSVASGFTETTTTLKGGGTATLDATDDHYNGRIIIFTSGVLQNQATDITDYTGSTNVFTVTALTEAPSDSDTFVIV